MSRWAFTILPISTLLAAVALGPTARAAEQAKLPNILWIVSEDNGPFLGCYGYPDANTPRLDRLAAEGILYRNAFSAAPVCAPTRCTMITGVYAPSLGTQHMRSRHRVNPEQVQFFVKHLRDAGYYCSNNSKTDYNLNPVQQDAWNQMTGGDHRKRAAGQPFFAVYNLGTSHESSLHKPLDKSLFEAKVTVPPYHPDTPEIRANWAMYHQIITRMDAQVGEILDKLEQEGVADDTIVFYYGDHGGILPRSKRFLYDTGVHIPLLVRFGKNFQHLAPGAAGTETKRLVNQVDFPPTVLSLAGVDVPDYMQGSAFLGKQAGEPREYVYCFRGRMDERYDFSRAVRDERFKYIRNYNPHRIYGQHLNYLWKMPATNSWQAEFLAGRCNEVQSRFWQTKPVEELYDVQADPWEVNNLAGDPAHAEVLARMREANRRHMLAIRDSGFWPEGEMVAQAGQGTIYDLVRDESRYPLERIMAAAELAGEARPADLEKLTALLADDHPAIRYWGATGCLILGEKGAAAKPALRKALDDASPDVRVTAAEALARLGELERPLAVLREALADKNPSVALHAANSLQELGEAARPALPELRRAAKSGNDYVKRAAEYTVEVLSRGE